MGLPSCDGDVVGVDARRWAAVRARAARPGHDLERDRGLRGGRRPRRLAAGGARGTHRPGASADRRIAPGTRTRRTRRSGRERRTPLSASGAPRRTARTLRLHRSPAGCSCSRRPLRPGKPQPLDARSSGCTCVPRSRTQTERPRSRQAVRESRSDGTRAAHAGEDESCILHAWAAGSRTVRAPRAHVPG